MNELVDGPVTVHVGDALSVLRQLPSESVHMCVTSPPYWGLRDYGTAEWEGGDAGCNHLVREDPHVESSSLSGGKATVGHQREGFKGPCRRCGARRVDSQLGLEPTPELYVEHLVEVFREVRRVLRRDGSCWLNLGDSYWGGGGGNYNENGKSVKGREGVHLTNVKNRYNPPGLKPKDLVGIPWMVAFALRADGWWLRRDVIWAKPNPMPESVTDRPTSSHEYLFLLTKAERYYYDADAVREALEPPRGGRQVAVLAGRRNTGRPVRGEPNQNGQLDDKPYDAAGRNLRSVWMIATQPYPDAHFATFPEDLIIPCIKAGTAEGGTVLDPFAGSGTTLAVARRLGRCAVGIELQADYLPLIRKRVEAGALPLLELIK